MKPFAIATCIALLVPASVFSAEEETLVRGARVRLTSAASSGARLQGTLDSIDATTLTLINDDHRMVNVSRAQITKVEMAWGRRGRAAEGIPHRRTGGLGHWPFGRQQSRRDVLRTRRLCALDLGRKGRRRALQRTAAYAAMGAGIGALVKTDRWVEVPPDKIRVSVAPTSGRGVAVGVTFGF